MRSTLLFALPFLFCVACEDKKPAPPPAASAPVPAAAASSPVPAPSASSATAVQATDPAKSGKMAHCPSAVDGAKTVINDVDGGVELTITAPAAPATGEIRSRTKLLADAVKVSAIDGGKTHNGSGEGGGVFGRCPIVLKNTVFGASDVEGGTKVTLVPSDKGELDWLRRETRERYADLSEAEGAVDAGAGGGKMGHCPNAVEGAATKLTDTKDGLDIIVTAKGDSRVQQIRDRARHLAKVALEDAGAPEHNGGGNGGGNLGRCPVIVQDTVVDVKDIEGGSKISVKASTAGKSAEMRKEAHDRALRFQQPLPAGSGAAPTNPGKPRPAK